MSILLHIADRVLNRPLLLSPEKAEVILGVLSGRIGLDLDRPDPQANGFVGATQASEDGRYKTYRQQDGVAIIGVMGSLVNRGAWIGASSGLTSYEGLTKQIGDAAHDPSIHSIMLDVNSPGGEAGGMFAVAKAVRAAARQKKVVAVVNDMAASAAYGIAAGASEVVVTESSIVGSIGVVMMHVDRSKQLAEAGVKPTFIHAGAHKVDGNSFEPLSDSVRASMQVEVDKIYNLFLEAVAAGRGAKLDKKAARSTEAKVFLGQEAVAQGLADRVGTFEDVLASLSGAYGAIGRPANGGLRMDNENQPGADASVNTTAASTVDTAAVAADAKARVKSILTCEAAKGRDALASHLAFDTDMSVEAATAILDKAPQASAAAPQAAAYLTEKAADGALGLASPIKDASQEANFGWSKAIAAANPKSIN